MSKETKKNICFISTTPFVILQFMMPHIIALSKFYDVTIISSGEKKDFDGLIKNNIHFIHIPIERKINFYSDLYCFFKLICIFNVKKFDIVHTLMPKAFVLGMPAAFFCNISTRIHTFTGQIWANKSGIKKIIFKLIDKFISKLATHLLADSHGQANFLIKEKIVKISNISVLANGSISGVDLERFKFSKHSRDKIRKKFFIKDNAFVILYVGRVNRDKGVLDLVKAFAMIKKTLPELTLIILGNSEDDTNNKIIEILSSSRNQYRLIPYSKNPEEFMCASDLLCLPSYREGFGNVLIEASAVGLPVIVSNIYGIQDAVIHGETGLLYQPGSVLQLKKTIIKLLGNTRLRKNLSRQAKIRVNQLYPQKIVIDAMINFYSGL